MKKNSLTTFSLGASRCSNRKAPATQYATTSVMRVTWEKTHVKTFHDTHKHEMHLLRGGGSSRSKRRVDILLHLDFTLLSSWLGCASRNVFFPFFIILLLCSFLSANAIGECGETFVFVRCRRSLSIHCQPETRRVYKAFRIQYWSLCHATCFSPSKARLNCRTLTSHFHFLWRDCDDTILPTNSDDDVADNVHDGKIVQ